MLAKMISTVEKFRRRAFTEFVFVPEVGNTLIPVFV